MQLKKREMRSAFSKLKMHIEKTHHKIAYFEYKGIEYLKTRISHGEGDIPKPVVERIRKQLYLNQAQFYELLKCPPVPEQSFPCPKSKNIRLTKTEQLTKKDFCVEFSFCELIFLFGSGLSGLGYDEFVSILKDEKNYSRGKLKGIGYHEPMPFCYI